MCQDVDKAYIVTFTGKQFFLLKPRLEDIDIIDIAHSEAMQCRWTGHSRYHYSIAQHSVLCSFLGPEDEALERLMHDGSEAYIGDWNRPLKHYSSAGDAYRKVEKPLQELVYQATGCRTIEPASVKIADEAMLYAELEQLTPWPRDFEVSNPHTRSKAADVKIEQWSPEYAERMFLERFQYLYKKRIN